MPGLGAVAGCLGGNRYASAMLWERLPQAGVDDSEQFRHLAVGPDGHLYLMVLTSSGAEILRRG